VPSAGNAHGSDAERRRQGNAYGIAIRRPSLMDQLKEIWIDRELERAEPANCAPKLASGGKHHSAGAAFPESQCANDG